MLFLSTFVLDQVGLGREKVACLTTCIQPTVTHYHASTRQAAKELHCTSDLGEGRDIELTNY